VEDPLRAHSIHEPVDRSRIGEIAVDEGDAPDLRLIAPFRTLGGAGLDDVEQATRCEVGEVPMRERQRYVPYTATPGWFASTYSARWLPRTP